MPFRLMPAASAILLLLLADASLASPCTDRIAAIEKRVDEMADAAASTSSGGQGVAASRESQAMQARDKGTPIAAPTVPPFQNEAKEVETTRKAAEEGGGGDRAMQARASLNQARALDNEGKSAACLDLVDEAERQLGTP